MIPRLRPVVLLGIVVLVVLALSPWIAGFDPLRISVVNRLKPPSDLHWFGTDDFGRDVFARVAHGARLSLWIGFLVAAFATLLGASIGLAAGFFRRADPFLARLIDALWYRRLRLVSVETPVYL